MGDGGGGSGDDCMLNIFTSSSKKSSEESKKRKANTQSLNHNNNKTNSDSSSGDPPLKKFKAEKSRGGEKKSKGKPIIKNRNHNDDDDDDNKSDKKNGKNLKKKATKEKKERGGAGHALTKDRPFISNLFTKNPEAPSIQVENEEEAPKEKEKVFSSSDVDANQFGFHTRINSILKGQFAVKHFTQVQLAAIPEIVRGRDTLVKSQTGSGKTLAYALPIIHSLMSREPKVDRVDGPYAVVIVPTRELVLQGFETFNKLCAGCTWIVPGQLMGGEKKKSEKARLRKGINILIATPGRLLDHLNTTETFQKQLPSLDFLVFDEADRLMDLGFEKDLNEIVGKIVEFRGSRKKTLQSILASATLNDDVARLVRISLYDPVTVDAAKMALEGGGGGGGVGAMTTPSTLRHHFLVCPHKLRLVALASFVLDKCRYSSSSASTAAKIIVFVATHKCVDFFLSLFDAVFNSTALRDVDLDAARATGVKWDPVKAEFDDDAADAARQPIAFFGLHGEMPQERRTKTFRSFKSIGGASSASSSSSPLPGQSSVLFCTDVGARGLDVADVSWIVQFHPPGPPEDYVHRVGRCARAGSAGSALLFLTPTETGYVANLRAKADIPTVEETPLLKLLKDGLLPGAKAYPEGGKDEKQKKKIVKMEDAATCVQLKMENVVSVGIAASDADGKNNNNNSNNHNNSKEEVTSTESKKDQPAAAASSLADLSKAAYFSFIRSYATYPKDLKQLGFNVKSLHLGHVAKSFALREPPSKMKDADGNVKAEKKKKKKGEGGGGGGGGGKKGIERTKSGKQLTKQFSEFSSGL